MAATTLPRPLPHFLEDSPSFSPLRRPSLEASSMKSRKSLLDILGSARRVTPLAPSGSKLRQETKPERAADVNDVREDQNKPVSTTQKMANDNSASNRAQRLRSKSRTVLRVISTKFRSTSPISPTSPPPANASPQAKQNREAALRERGLLPPLKPNKDLSRQEAEQDAKIPVVTLDRSSSEDVAPPSAADLIRREWEAKNQSTKSEGDEERERMNTFRFGGSPSAEVFPELAQAPKLETVSEIITPQPSPVADRNFDPPPLPSKDTPSDQSRVSVDERDELGPSSIPLPASPLPTPPPTPSKITSRKSLSQSSLTNHPPSSFHLSRQELESSSSASSHNRHGSAYSQRSISALSPTTNPVMSLTPPPHVTEFTPVPSRRSGSLTQMPSISESLSSVATPSLNTSSPTATSVSTLNTVESPISVVSAGNAGTGKGKTSMLRVKTNHGHNIPMIIESPVEDGVLVASPQSLPRTIPEEVQLPLSPVSEVHSTSSLAVPQVDLKPVRRSRMLTEPPTRLDKRKSFNLFKRGQSAGVVDEPITNERPKSLSSKRLSVSASLSNLRKVATNLTRPKSVFDAAAAAAPSSPGGRRMFDASHLPPSPTLPKNFELSAGASAEQLTDGGLAPPRRPVDPVLHSRGSILLEASTIQDEEVRRMTELAFLG